MKNPKNILFFFVLCLLPVQLFAENQIQKAEKFSVVEAKIFPNPVVDGGFITIDARKELNKIQVVNIVGSIVYYENILPAVTYNLNTEGLDKGIYLMKIIYTDNTSDIKRIWVK